MQVSADGATAVEDLFYCTVSIICLSSVDGHCSEDLLVSGMPACGGSDDSSTITVLMIRASDEPICHC